MIANIMAEEIQAGKFCVKCGRPVFARTNYCEKCLSEQYNLFRIKSKIVRCCRSCGLYEVNKNKQWLEFKSDRDAALYMAEHAIKPAGEIKKKEFSARAKGNRVFVDITCTGSVFIPGTNASLDKKEKREMVITFKKMKCDVCSKLSGNYHEALLQLRGNRADQLLKAVKKMAGKREITKIDTKKEGHDVFFMFKRDARRLVGKLRKGNIAKDIKKSYKLKGQKQGKRLYRDYYAIR